MVLTRSFLPGSRVVRALDDGLDALVFAEEGPQIRVPVVLPDGEPPIKDLSFSDMDLTLWRGRSWCGRVKAGNLSHFGPKWGRVFSCYVSAIPKKARPYFIQNLVRAVPDGRIGEESLIKTLKLISTEASRLLIQHGPGPYSYLSDLHVLAGYDTVLNRVDVLKGYEQVFTGKLDQSVLLPYIDKVISWIRFKDVSLRVADFVKFRDGWATAGASTHGAPLEIKHSKGSMRIRGKFASTVKYTDNELVRMMFSKEEAVIKPFRKLDEPAKTRVVQSYDLRSYLRCSYAEMFVSDLNGVKTWTTLNMRPADRHLARKRLAAAMRSGYHALCTDQSSFDTNQSAENVAYVISSLFKRAARVAMPSLRGTLRRLGEIEVSSFKRARVIDSQTKRTIGRWERGVPSGHRWTALIDSVLNAAASLYVAEKASLRVGPSLWQGDDAIMMVHTRPDAERIAEIYSSLGMKVNPEKTWVSADSYEYLHEFNSLRHGTWGMPARAFKSLLWKKPLVGTASFTPPHLAKFELWDTARKCARRGLNVVRGLLRSVSNTLRVKSKVLRDFLRTPVAMGGLGFGLSGRTALRVKAPRIPRGLTINSRVGVAARQREHAFHYVSSRVASSVPLPNLKATYVLERVKGITGVKLRAGNPLVYRWDVRDSFMYPDAWERNLELWYCVDHRKPIPDKCVRSTSLKRLGAAGRQLAYTMLRAFSGWAPDFSTNTTAFEPFHEVRAWLKSVWNGIVAFAAVSGRRGLLGKETLFAIAAIGWKAIQAGGRVVRVAL